MLAYVKIVQPFSKDKLFNIIEDAVFKWEPECDSANIDTAIMSNKQNSFRWFLRESMKNEANLPSVSLPVLSSFVPDVRNGLSLIPDAFGIQL